jgi:hypothetical protein
MPAAAATGVHRVVNLARVSSGLWAADCYAHLASVLSSALPPASGNPGRPHTQVLRGVDVAMQRNHRQNHPRPVGRRVLPIRLPTVMGVVAETAVEKVC